MKTITVRHIDSSLEHALAERMRQQGKSMNTTIVGLLRETLGLEQPKLVQRKCDLDHLAGTWSEKDEEQFNQATQSFNSIDPDMWP